jgi:hypothetical protein
VVKCSRSGWGRPTAAKTPPELIEIKITFTNGGKGCACLTDLTSSYPLYGGTLKGINHENKTHE